MNMACPAWELSDCLKPETEARNDSRLLFSRPGQSICWRRHKGGRHQPESLLEPVRVEWRFAHPDQTCSWHVNVFTSCSKCQRLAQIPHLRRGRKPVQLGEGIRKIGNCDILQPAGASMRVEATELATVLLPSPSTSFPNRVTAAAETLVSMLLAVGPLFAGCVVLGRRHHEFGRDCDYHTTVHKVGNCMLLSSLRSSEGSLESTSAKMSGKTSRSQA